MAGQLSLMMLCEMLHNKIKDLKILQINTDGITVIINREDKKLYWGICKEWENITKLNLEYVAYDKMIIRDVNNYCAVDTKGKIKRKGAFKTHAEMKKDGEWYKAFNQGIVPIALSEYFINNVPVEKTVTECKDIYMFTKTFSATHGWKTESLIRDEYSNEIDIKEESKTTRYFISNTGRIFRKRKEALKPKYNKSIEDIKSEDIILINSILEKVNENIQDCILENIVSHSSEIELNIKCSGELYKALNRNDTQLNYFYGVNKVIVENSEEFEIKASKCFRVIEIEAGNVFVTLFNKYVDKPFNEYDINLKYYIEEANKIIELIIGEKERKENELKEKRLSEKIERERTRYIENCVNKLPTERMYNELRKEWMDGIFPSITEFKPSPKRKNEKEKEEKEDS